MSRQGAGMIPSCTAFCPLLTASVLAAGWTQATDQQCGQRRAARGRGEGGCRAVVMGESGWLGGGSVTGAWGMEGWNKETQKQADRQKHQ